VSVKQLFDVYATALELLGRDPTLTDRTELWSDALTLADKPILGAGFESFWLGWRREILWQKWWWRPTQAHNGYIEIYLNLGIIGVTIIGGLIISTFFKASKQLKTDLDMGKLRLGFLLAIVFYNYSEAAFTALHIMWIMFFLVAMDYPVISKAQIGDKDPGGKLPR
jgi:O-antigen ligase